jgi:hypothetical protein
MLNQLQRGNKPALLRCHHSVFLRRPYVIKARPRSMLESFNRHAGHMAISAITPATPGHADRRQRSPHRRPRPQRRPHLGEQQPAQIRAGRGAVAGELGLMAYPQIVEITAFDGSLNSRWALRGGIRVQRVVCCKSWTSLW